MFPRPVTVMLRIITKRDEAETALRRAVIQDDVLVDVTGQHMHRSVAATFLRSVADQLDGIRPVPSGETLDIESDVDKNEDSTPRADSGE